MLNNAVFGGSLGKFQLSIALEINDFFSSKLQ